MIDHTRFLTSSKNRHPHLSRSFKVPWEPQHFLRDKRCRDSRKLQGTALQCSAPQWFFRHVSQERSEIFISDNILSTTSLRLRYLPDSRVTCPHCTFLDSPLHHRLGPIRRRPFIPTQKRPHSIRSSRISSVSWHTRSYARVHS